MKLKDKIIRGKMMKLEPNLANMLSIGGVFTSRSVKYFVIYFTLQVRFNQFL